jgi:hypothetical protein
MIGSNAAQLQPVPVRFTPLFEARWSYQEFIRVMPFGPSSEGQAMAYSGPARVEGERLSGAYRLTQFPRARVDGVLLPDAHGIIRTETGRVVMTRAAGFGVPDPSVTDRRIVTHWMRFWSAVPELAWLNATMAYGVGSFEQGEASVRYFGMAPAREPAEPPEGAPALEFLGTARWEYTDHETVRPFGDDEGVGYAVSTGDVDGGSIRGTWRGWHYPTYLRDGLTLVDGHAEIERPGAVILNRHGGLATPPEQPSNELIYDVAHHATFFTEAPELERLNRTLALGVGYVHASGLVTLSYYVPSAGS